MPTMHPDPHQPSSLPCPRSPQDKSEERESPRASDQSGQPLPLIQLHRPEKPPPTPTPRTTPPLPARRRQASEDFDGFNDDEHAVADGTGSDSDAYGSVCRTCNNLNSRRDSAETNSSSLGGLHDLKKPRFQLQLPAPLHLFSSLSLDGESDQLPSFLKPGILTPPEEITLPQWDTHRDRRPQPDTLTLSPASGSTNPPINLTEGDQAVEHPSPKMDEPQQDPSEMPPGGDDALTSAVNLVVQTVAENADQSTDKKIVVQVLPNPTNEPNQTLPISLWNSLLDRLLDSRSLTARWISAVHAIPTTYPVDELPASAPSTPNPGGMADAPDYFTPHRVVHTAAFMSDQYDVYTPRSRPATPGLASNPKSVDVALYQRLIPPATAREVSELFDVASRSALADRLTELAPNGCMLFFYPTATGGRTFKTEYLDRGLASLVRAALLGKGLPSEACSVVANVESLSAMPEFDTMHNKLRRLLRDMQESAVSEGACFSILSASREKVELPHKAWRGWWIKQEERRVKAVIERYFKKMESSGRHFHRDERYTPRGITEEILLGLAKESSEPPSASAQLPLVEVGIFVIKRNS